MKIYIDVGHGGVDSTGSDTGTHGDYQGKTYIESEINLDIAIACKNLLTSLGHSVVMSRAGAVNKGDLVGSYSRADSNLINSAYACRDGDYDAMISIHNNSSSNTSARGYQLIYKTGDGCKDESKKLAGIMDKKLGVVTNKNAVYESVSNKNGKDNYGILRLHDKIGVLCECLFMSNSADMGLISEGSILKAIGEAIARAIHEYSGEAAQNHTIADDAYKALNEKYGVLEANYKSLSDEYEASKARFAETEQEYQQAIFTLEKDLTAAKSELALERSKYEEACKIVKGDMNGDGVVTAEDAIKLLKKVMNQ